jgi:NAD-dependent dihydropyrimidine dehydrogenase PreA subunit
MSIRPAWWMTLQALMIPLVNKMLRETRTTMLGRIAGWFTVPMLSGKNFNITYLPIHYRISDIGETLLPQVVLRELVRQSAHRAIIKRCTCRDGGKCGNHQVELGCLLLGEGAAEIDTGVSRHISVDEALDHVDRCVENGLTPFAGRFKADDYIWGVKDRGKLLTICFCCACCCVIRKHLRYLPEISKASVIRLKGLEIITDPERCNACGICTDACFMEARKITDGKLVYDPSRCKGCGHCLSICPEKAVSANVADIGDAVSEVWGRIDRLIDFR